jgi:hypothetical protein
VEKPSLFRIITIDYSSFAIIFSPIIAWGLYGVISVFGIIPDFRWGREPLTGEDLPIMLSVATFATGLAIPLLVWRVRVVWSTFIMGVEVPGQVVKIFFFRDRGRVEYTYTYQGHTYRRGNAIMKTKRTKALELNSQVTLVVHPNKPERAVIRDLYVS